MRSRSYILFIAALAVIVAGFWPSFFSAPRSNDVAHTLHGLFATGWLILLIAQSLLIDRRHYALHRRIGWLSVALVVALVGTSLNLVRVMTANPVGYPPGIVPVLVYIDLTTIALFVLLYVTALVYRRHRPIHARLLGSTAFVAMIPALGRFYPMNIAEIGRLDDALDPSFWTVEAILVLLIVSEIRARGRPYAPFPLVLIAFVLIELTMRPVGASPAFSRLIGLG